MPPCTRARNLGTTDGRWDGGRWGKPEEYRLVAQTLLCTGRSKFGSTIQLDARVKPEYPVRWLRWPPPFGRQRRRPLLPASRLRPRLRIPTGSPASSDAPPGPCVQPHIMVTSSSSHAVEHLDLACYAVTDGRAEGLS